MALLGIKVPQSVAKTLRQIDTPGKKEDSSDFHITLLIFNEHMSVSEVAKSVEAIGNAIKNVNPFKLKLNKVSCFPKREDNPVPIIMPIESKELQDLQSKLKKALKKHKVDFDTKFKEYRPHITLSYDENEVDDFKIDKEEFTVDEIILWSGDEGLDEKELFVTFPLSSKNKKHSSLLRRIEYFYKIAIHL